jgi:hypothetical protein
MLPGAGGKFSVYFWKGHKIKYLILEGKSASASPGYLGKLYLQR